MTTDMSKLLNGKVIQKTLTSHKFFNKFIRGSLGNSKLNTGNHLSDWCLIRVKCLNVVFEDLELSDVRQSSKSSSSHISHSATLPQHLSEQTHTKLFDNLYLTSTGRTSRKEKGPTSTFSSHVSIYRILCSHFLARFNRLFVTLFRTKLPILTLSKTVSITSVAKCLVV